MAMRGVDFKWYDGFFLSMLATSVIIVSLNWKRYHLCDYPLHIWIVVDYTTVFIFRILMFVDNGLAAGLGLDFGSQQRNAGFCGRVVVLSILSLLLYPFLWAWTVVGTLWFIRAKSCLPEEGQKWGFLIWLIFSYSGLVCITFICVGKFLARRRVHLLRAQQGIPISEFGILVDMIRVPDWAFEAAGQDMRGISQDADTYHPGLYLTPAQTEAVEALIQELPKFKLKTVPDNCGECLICLEEFHIDHEVRGLPCAHNFHVECIDQWLRLNIKCPRCRCSVFPDLNLSALTNLQTSETQQPSQGESYFLRLQSLIHPVHTDTSLETTENSGVHTDTALETAENGGVHTNTALETTDNSGVHTDTALETAENDRVHTDIALETAENGGVHPGLTVYLHLGDE